MGASGLKYKVAYRYKLRNEAFINYVFRNKKLIYKKKSDKKTTKNDKLKKSLTIDIIETF